MSQARVEPSPLKTAERLAIAATDGYPLVALRYVAVDAPIARVLIAPATGVAQSYYARFARALAARGFEVLSLDYRGIGLSKPENLRGFEADFEMWAARDFRALVDAQPDDLPLLHVGHSIGCHVLGMSDVGDRFRGSWMFAPGAGWYGYMDFVERLKVLFSWHVAMPLMAAPVGYLPWSLAGMGEDLPLGVYRQWKRWCQLPHFFADDPKVAHLVPRCERLRLPIYAYTALDDLWAPPASRDAFLGSTYTQATVHRADLPVQKKGEIGHVGYFRSSQQALWERVGDEMLAVVDGLK